MTTARRELAKITKERDVLRTVTDYLTAENLWWMRCNSGLAWGPPAVEGALYHLHAAAERSRIKLAPAGTADLLVIVPPDRTWIGRKNWVGGCGWPVPFWIELKRPRGGRRRPEQIAFAEYMLSIGCLHIFASDVADVMAVIPPRIEIRKIASAK